MVNYIKEYAATVLKLQTITLIIWTVGFPESVGSWLAQIAYGFWMTVSKF